MGGHRGRAALLCAALALGACGGEQSAEAPVDFARAADAVCAQARDQIASAPQPRSLAEMGEVAQRGLTVVRGAVARLDALRSERAGTLPQGAQAFYGALPGVLAASEAVARATTARDAGASRRAARRLQAAGDRAFDAAQAAGLDSCGRGGNQAADAVLLAVYRHEYLLIHEDVGSRFSQLGEPSESLEGSSEETLGLLREYQRRFKRLGPPSDLEEAHERLLARNDAAIETLEELDSILSGPSGAPTRAEVQRLLARLDDRVERAQAAERRLRQAAGLPSIGRDQRVPEPVGPPTGKA